MIKTLLCTLGSVACISSSFAGLEHPADVDKRQCRSVHLNYANPPKGNKAVYLESKALASAPGTYFSTLNFHEGYFGFQELANGKKVIIFSVWDPGVSGLDNKTRPDQIADEKRVQLVAKGEGVNTTRFGGEGTGGKSMLDYDWQIGQPIKFLVTYYDKDNGQRQVVSGWFYDQKAGKWQLMSSWETRADKQRLDFASSFVEDFRRNYESATKVRKAEFGPLFYYTKDNKWVQIDAATFNADSNPAVTINAGIGADGKSFMLQTGGDTSMKTPLRTTMKLDEKGKKVPAPDAAATKIAIEGSTLPATPPAPLTSPQ